AHAVARGRTVRGVVVSGDPGGVGGLGRASLPRAAPARRRHVGDVDRGTDLLSLSLHRTLWRHAARLFLRIPYHRRSRLQRPVLAAGIRRNRLDARALRYVLDTALNARRSTRYAGLVLVFRILG